MIIRPIGFPLRVGDRRNVQCIALDHLQASPMPLIASGDPFVNNRLIVY